VVEDTPTLSAAEI